MADQKKPCERCGEVHDGMLMSGACHPGAPCFATLNQETNELELSCAICDKPVVTMTAFLPGVAEDVPTGKVLAGVEQFL